MANPYAGLGTSANAMASVKGGSGDSTSLTASGATYSTKAVLKRLAPFVRGHLTSLALAFVLAASTTILQLIVPILTGRAIDTIIGAGSVRFDELAPILEQIVLVIAFAALTQWLFGWLVARLSTSVTYDLRTQAFNKLSRLPVKTIDGHAHGDLLARVATDVDQVGDGLLQGLTQLFSGTVAIVGTLTFMLSISVPVALLVVVLTPLSAAVAAGIARASSQSFAQQQRLQGELSGYVDEMVSNQRLVFTFGYGDRSNAAFAKMNEDLRVVGEHAQFVSSLSNPSTRLVNNLIYAAVAVAGCLSVLGILPTSLTVGQVQSFLAYANQYMKPFNEISGVVTQVQAAFASAARVFELLDATEMEPDAQPSPATAATGDKNATPGSLDFNHVAFSYTPDAPLLRDITFQAKAGERIALVGTTGCGKTTLINLLLRFYDVDEGIICVDERDISEIPRADLRHRFGMVLQQTWLFQGTVRDNIAYGREDASDEEIVSAATRAHAHGFIQQLPQGYDTLIGEQGSSLSLGERQLICIARAILNDAPILLLDEATSSIDTRTELQVQAAFDEMMQGRTSLVVAHRLSTIRNADRILVMDAGRIAEQGTHEELLAKDGLYAHLYRANSPARAEPCGFPAFPL